MGAAEAMDRFLGEEREIAARKFGGGSVALVARVEGPSFRVDRIRDGVRATIFETIHQDEALHVFEATPAEDPAWHAAYLPVGRPQAPLDDLTTRVFAAGETVEGCVRAFLSSKGAQLDGDSLVVEAERDKPEFQWGARFSERDGAAYKTAGRSVPGGHVMTWWT